MIGVQGKEDTASVPETGNTVRTFLAPPAVAISLTHLCGRIRITGLGNSDETRPCASCSEHHKR